MSHLRPEDVPVVHKRSACKKGRHRYGKARGVGGGITRQVCVACGAVSIDLTGAVEPLDTAAAIEQHIAPQLDT